MPKNWSSISQVFSPLSMVDEIVSPLIGKSLPYSSVHGAFSYGCSRSCHSGEVEESLEWLIAETYYSSENERHLSRHRRAWRRLAGFNFPTAGAARQSWRRDA